MASRQPVPAPSARSMDGAPLVVLKNLAKDYPGVRALRDVSLDLRRGEVHALIGENGAGKSTLIRILSGDVRPDGGSISIDGEPVVFDGPRDARRRGIVTIFQELTIVPDLSVAENIFLGNEPGSLFYSRSKAERRTAEVLTSLGAGSKCDHPNWPAISRRPRDSSLKLLVRWCCAHLSSLWMSRPRPCRKMKRRPCAG